MKKKEFNDDIKYMVIDDTIDVGKEPLPLTEADKKIHDEFMQRLKDGYFDMKE